MIIEARGDIVSLCGTLSENHWAAIAAAVDLLLPDHPQGILMDCSALTSMTDIGGATFMDGLSYLEERGARILLCAVPPHLIDQLKNVPGLHSQVPVTATIEEGRRSLEAAGSAPLTARASGRVILVPVNPPFSPEAVHLLFGRLKPGLLTEIHFIYVVLVPRSLPVGSPIPEEETRAENTLTRAEDLIEANFQQRHVVRGRSVAEAILEASGKLKPDEIVIGLSAASVADERVGQIIHSLRERTPCPLTFTQEPAPEEKAA